MPPCIPSILCSRSHRHADLCRFQVTFVKGISLRISGLCYLSKVQAYP